MKSELIRFLLPMTAFLLCAALEETLPKVVSVGFPLVMTAALAFGLERTRLEGVILAILAGTLEDALGALPFATTASFLIVAILFARMAPVPRPVPLLLAYPLYQLWLVVWTPLPAGAFWNRLLVSVPVAALTALAVAPVLFFCERRIVSDAR